MVSKALASLLSLGVFMGWALPSFAQPLGAPGTPSAPLGPTRFFIIPKADVLPSGTAVTSLNLQLSTIAPGQVMPGIGTPTPSSPGLGLGFGYGGNALDLSNQTAMGSLFELDTGISAYATTPWQGRVDVAGKLGLLQQKLGSLASVAGMAGVALNVNANGMPSLGFTVGVPVTTTLSLSPMNHLTLSAYPNWGTGLVAPGLIQTGVIPPTRFALGLGGSLTLTDTVMLLADTSLLGIGPGAPNEGADFGVRFGYSPNVTFDIYASTAPNIAPTSAFVSRPLSISAGMNWSY